MGHARQYAVIVLCALLGGVLFWATGGGNTAAGGIAIGAGVGVAISAGVGATRKDPEE